MKLGNLLIALMFILAACSSTEETQTLNLPGNDKNLEIQTLEQAVPDEASSDFENTIQENAPNPQAQAVLAGQFQSFFLDNNNVKIIDTQEAEWSDSCLGIDQPGVECIPQPTQGYEIKLEANGLQFDYHADIVGGQLHPATIGLIWIRQGGEKQLCDRLIIYLPDVAHICSCDSGELRTSKVNLHEILSMEEYEQFIALLKNFTKNSLNNSTLENSKPVDVSLIFHGQGNTSPNSEDQQNLLTMAENIFSRVSP